MRGFPSDPGGGREVVVGPPVDRLPDQRCHPLGNTRCERRSQLPEARSTLPDAGRRPVETALRRPVSTPCWHRSDGPPSVPAMETDQPTAAAMRRALARARDGKTLDVDEATILLHARGDDLDQLLTYAARVRDAGLAAAGRPGVITYSRKVFIPLTRLCRDRCHYCTFVTVPGRAGSRRTCRRTRCWTSPGRAPRWAARRRCSPSATGPRTAGRQAREWLDAHGYDDTLSYVRAMAIRVLEETGLLPHLNPGVLTWQDLQRLKPVAPSMGMMLETTATPAVHRARAARTSARPDKDPAVRLRVLEDAGRSNVPFTTGILIGIGETLAERAESLFAIRQVAREYGGMQEVIVQNFRAKPDTAMRAAPDADLAGARRHHRGRPAGARPAARIQAPPNLVDGQYELLLRGRHRRLGRRLAAHPRPRQPRAAVAADRRPGRAHRRRPGSAARAADRSTRRYSGRRAVAGPAAGPARRRAGRPATGLAGRRRMPRGPALAGARRRLVRAAPAAPTCTSTIDTDGPHRRPARATSTRCTATGTRSRDARSPRPAPPPRGSARRRRWPRCAAPSATRPGSPSTRRWRC